MARLHHRRDLRGVAGGILAFLKGTIDPTWLAIPQSIEGLVMVLLGGVQTLAGPLVGAALYHGAEIWFSTLTRYWPLILGLIIVALVLAFPRTASSSWHLAAAAGPRPLDDGPRGQGLAKAFGGIRAVTDVGFGLAAGELLALIGPTAPARPPASTA